MDIDDFQQMGLLFVEIRNRMHMERIHKSLSTKEFQRPHDFDQSILLNPFCYSCIVIL